MTVADDALDLEESNLQCLAIASALAQSFDWSQTCRVGTGDGQDREETVRVVTPSTVSLRKKSSVAMANVPSSLESWLSVEMAEDALAHYFLAPFASVRSCKGVAAVFRHLEVAMLLVFRQNESNV